MGARNAADAHPRGDTSPANSVGPTQGLSWLPANPLEGQARCVTPPGALHPPSIPPQPRCSQEELSHLSLGARAKLLNRALAHPG